MVALRCTKKLLARVGPPQEVTEPTTTVLGDWYACPLNVGHQRFVLLISEHSRLPVLTAGRDLKHIADNFPDALAAMLWGLGVDAVAIRREVEATREAVIATDKQSSPPRHPERLLVHAEVAASRPSGPGPRAGSPRTQPHSGWAAGTC